MRGIPKAGGHLTEGHASSPRMVASVKKGMYPLVNVDITREHHHFLWENPLYMAMFNSYATNSQRVHILVGVDQSYEAFGHEWDDKGNGMWMIWCYGLWHMKQIGKYLRNNCEFKICLSDLDTMNPGLSSVVFRSSRRGLPTASQEKKSQFTTLHDWVWVITILYYSLQIFIAFK